MKNSAAFSFTFNGTEYKKAIQIPPNTTKDKLKKLLLDMTDICVLYLTEVDKDAKPLDE